MNPTEARQILIDEGRHLLTAHRQEKAAWQARREMCAATNPAHAVREALVEMPSGEYSRSEGPYVAVRRMACPRCAGDPKPLLDWAAVDATDPDDQW